MRVIVRKPTKMGDAVYGILVRQLAMKTANLTGEAVYGYYCDHVEYWIFIREPLTGEKGHGLMAFSPEEGDFCVLPEGM